MYFTNDVHNIPYVQSSTGEAPKTCSQPPDTVDEVRKIILNPL